LASLTERVNKLDKSVISNEEARKSQEGPLSDSISRLQLKYGEVKDTFNNHREQFK